MRDAKLVRWAIRRLCLRCPTPITKGRHCDQHRLMNRVWQRDWLARTGYTRRVTTVSAVRWRYLTGEAR